jgi:hypothetical protein
LNALQKFGTNLDEFLHLLLPPIVKLLDAPDVPFSVKRIALETIDQLNTALNFSDFLSRFVLFAINQPMLYPVHAAYLHNLIDNFLISQNRAYSSQNA